ncbi:hypothetical protein FB382_003764 [Nocardioides ginsengisegetis]|uniref:Uncharacterized protein n=1 Tax=Nocardioides ginsengisegetis TaxID=661491 RepID=A0A7W3J368_9ACTN|nr:hypothetical protein [Nocardioides ginsengisegetis]MBA8805473.1 hypothetical protein [Nocardioides ginsengisegetis]
MGGERSTEQEARRRATLYAPNSPRANADILEGYWICGSGAPLLQYPDVSVHYENGWSSIDVVQNFTSQIKESGEGEVIDLSGQPALMRIYDNVGGELLVRVKDTMIDILGDASFTAADYRSVGESIIAKTGK